MQSLAPLADALAQFEAGALDAASLARACRAQTHVVSQLPAAFSNVLDDIVTRLEAGAMFSEESCSFSQGDLVAQLQIWLAKAQEKLALKNGAPL
jgi:exonuclease VII small subunit